MPGGLGPFIPLIGGTEGPYPWHKSTSASIVFTATAAASHLYSKSASASIVFTATAAHGFAPSVLANATIVFTATASQSQTKSGSATATIVFHPTATFVPTHTFPPKLASAQIIFKARSRGKRPGAKFGDGYLGRYQIGQDVPLCVQCVDNNGNPSVPDGAPLAIVVGSGVAVCSFTIPADPDPDATGRFRGRYTLGEGDGVGHYAVVYLYSLLGLPRGESDQFEVVPGGDKSGPIIAAYSFDRPGGDFLLAHLATGRIASGQTPYLDEGI